MAKNTVVRSIVGSFTIALSIAGVLAFQNCAPGFEVLNKGDLLGQSGSDGSLEQPPDVPTNPGAPLSVYVRNTTINQGSDATFKVELNKVHPVPVTVALQTKAGTARLLIDVADERPTVIIPAGELSANVTVKTYVPLLAITDKTFSLEAISTSAGQIAQANGVALVKALQKALSVKDIALGVQLSTILLSDGSVRSNGSINPDLSSLTGVKEVVAGAAGGCALTAQDNVKCWGYGYDGELGLPLDTVLSLTPLEIQGTNGAKQLAGNYATHCILTATNSVKCWGRGTDGQLGNGTTGNSFTPVDVTGLTDIKSISVGGSHACAITAQNTVKCWGDGRLGQLGQGQLTGSAVPIDVPGLVGIKMISLGSTHACVLTAQDTVKCWGYNISGQLGTGDLTNSNVPVDVAGLSAIKSIHSGTAQTCVVTATDTMKCWGQNVNGKLGNGQTVTSTTPVDVIGVASAKTIRTGYNTTCAINAANALSCWGYMTLAMGHIGTFATTSIPVDVAGLASGVKEIATYGAHSCIVTAQDTVKCWGANTSQQLGNAQFAPSETPVDVIGSAGLRGLTIGPSHSCALTPTGGIKCWGSNGTAQLGQPATTATLPTLTDVPGLTGMTQVSTGISYTCALTATGGVKCWGQNGPTGGTNTLPSEIPNDVQGITGAKMITTGNGHSCAITAVGGVKCWGFNAQGQLGTGVASLNEMIPVDVPGVTGTIQISAGATHTCALSDQGLVRCWGNNSTGQLGNGTTAPNGTAVTPTLVSGLNGVKKIDAGGSSTCALLTTGAAKCWGYGAHGRLASGSTKTTTVPVDVVGMTGIANVAMGNVLSLWLTADGRVRSSGSRIDTLLTSSHIATESQ